jgi:hypothetical protein
MGCVLRRAARHAGQHGIPSDGHLAYYCRYRFLGRHDHCLAISGWKDEVGKHRLRLDPP